ncbi:TetR family transcriptional regulator [Burkholderia arboris]|uniref:TetR family transcriptional regulator n=1 Tax=Burkholderia arboris TaxID=488730 RepID=UPI001CF31D48|nr:TetR family transcriptional regulator [Burkholderia arboris]MCA8492788.1 TetR family transcriptional regulator [Burkholderia arboris]
MKNKNIKMSIAAVAAEAGVSPSLVHNTYPDIAEEIRAQVGRSVRQQRDEKATELTNAHANLRALREELRAARRDIAKLASVNETLNDEVAVLRAAVDGKVRTLPRREDR